MKRCAPSLLTLVLLTSGAQAADSDVTVTAYTGMYGGKSTGGLMAGGQALLRMGLLAIGAEGDYGEWFGRTRASGCGTAGMSWRTFSGVRLDVLGAVGYHSYRGIGRRMLSDDPGVSWSSGFVGTRGGLSYIFGMGKTHFELGLLLSYDLDLVRSLARYEYQEEDGWFGNGGGQAEAEHAVGQASVGLSFGAGATFDL